MRMITNNYNKDSLVKEQKIKDLNKANLTYMKASFRPGIRAVKRNYRKITIRSLKLSMKHTLKIDRVRNYSDNPISLMMMKK